MCLRARLQLVCFFYTFLWSQEGLAGGAVSMGQASTLKIRVMGMLPSVPHPSRGWKVLEGDLCANRDARARAPTLRIMA